MKKTLILLIVLLLVLVSCGKKPATGGEETPTPETPVVETPTPETPVVEETPAVETPAVETPAPETKVDETPVVETSEYEKAVESVLKLELKHDDFINSFKDLGSHVDLEKTMVKENIKGIYKLTDNKLLARVKAVGKEGAPQNINQKFHLLVAFDETGLYDKVFMSAIETDIFDKKIAFGDFNKDPISAKLSFVEVLKP